MAWPFTVPVLVVPSASLHAALVNCHPVGSVPSLTAYAVPGASASDVSFAVPLLVCRLDANPAMLCVNGNVSLPPTVFFTNFRAPCFVLVNVHVVVLSVSYTHLRAHETGRNLVCRLLLEKKK